MKKQFIVVIFSIILVMVLFTTGCKKEKSDQFPASENNFRLVEQSLLIYDDTSTHTNKFTYSDEKLAISEYYIDGELYLRSHYAYGPGLIYRSDTNYIPDHPPSKLYSQAEYKLVDGLIVQILGEGEYISSLTFTYDNQILIKWEQFLNSGKADSRGEYDYQGDELMSYKYFYNINEGWILAQKNEYTYQGGQIDDVNYYYGILGPAPSEPQMKRTFSYNGNSIDESIWYYPDTSDNWSYYMESQFSYNANGLLVEVYEFQEAEGAEYPYYKFTFQYEPGKGNKEIFDKVNITLPLLERGFHFWGLF